MEHDSGSASEHLLDPVEWLADIRADIDHILLTPTEDLDAPVAACPGWSVAELVHHHAGVFRFATAQLRAEPGSDLATYDPPDEGPALDVFAGAARDLLAALEATDPGEHRPNWADAPTAAFWFRRMAQETAVHRWDVQQAVGQADPITTMLAIDGIDELSDTFLRFAGRRGITGHGETVHLHATDAGLPHGTGEWMFTFTADGVEVTHEHGKGDMAGRGPASDLLLFAWNRRPVELTCFGEPDLLMWWPTHVSI